MLDPEEEEEMMMVKPNKGRGPGCRYFPIDLELWRMKHKFTKVKKEDDAGEGPSKTREMKKSAIPVGENHRVLCSAAQPRWSSRLAGGTDEDQPRKIPWSGTLG